MSMKIAIVTLLLICTGIMSFFVYKHLETKKISEFHKQSLIEASDKITLGDGEPTLYKATEMTSEEASRQLDAFLNSFKETSQEGN